MELQGNNFGERLLEARKAKEFTRENLAKLVHISSKTIANYESGERYPTIDIASRLAAALDVSVASLLGEEGEIIEKARKDFGSKGDSALHCWKYYSDSFYSAVYQTDI